MADRSAASTEELDAAASERKLGRLVGAAIPVLSVAGAVTVGFTQGLGAGVLVLLGGALLGAVAFFWASLRTLSGDAPLPSGMENVTVRRGRFSDLEERKVRVLRALKDLENERRYGKIDQVDYDEVAAAYREEAKELMKEQDADLAPQRERAEAIAREYLARRGLGAIEAESTGGAGNKASRRQREERPSSDKAGATPARKSCPDCETSNEPDAAFCKKCGARLSAEESTE